MFFIWNFITNIEFMVPIIYRETCHNFNFSYLHMESDSGLIFKIISSLGNLDLQTKFYCSKLLGKRIQEKLYFNNIASIKSMFLAN